MFEIKITNLVKKYGKKPVLKINSLNFQEGEVVGIIGKNGSGKTTLAEIILGTKSKTSGEINYSIENLRKNAVFQETSFDDEVNLKHNYLFYKKLFDDQRKAKNKISQEDDFKKYGLTGLEKHKFSTLSGGQKQRFKIMIAMANNPQVILFDEVSNSLDLKTKKWFEETLARKKTSGEAIIFVISHDPAELIKLCTRIIKIDQQEIVYDQEILKTKLNEQKLARLMEDES